MDAARPSIIWASPGPCRCPQTPVENGVVEGRIVDAQSMLNVNNLASATRGAAERRRFARLFARLGIAQSTLDSLIDWIDTDDAPQPGGAEDAWYLQQADASLAANGPATRIEELGYVRGMAVPVMTRVLPYVTALPDETPLNVNTASAEALAASFDGIEPAALAALLADRATRPFTSLADFRARLPIPLADEWMFSVNSHFFLVTVRARQGDTFAQARALIRRREGAWPAIVWQTIE